MRLLFVNKLDGLVAYGIAPALKVNGHEVIELGGYEKLSADQGCTQIWNDIMRTRPDYLFFVGTGVGVPAFDMMITACKNFHVGLIFWAIEDPVEYQVTCKFAEAAALVLTPSIECVRMYQRRGIPAELFLFACNPNIHKQGIYQPDLDHDICLYANCYTNHPVRMRGYDIIVDAAMDMVIQDTRNLKIYGNYWDTEFGLKKVQGRRHLLGGLLNTALIPDLCTSSRIILGVQCLDCSDTQVSSRTYEILGCGGFHLTQWTMAIENQFKEGVHLATAKTKGEAREKMKYYLNHFAVMQKIAAAGQAFVYKEHTFEKRVTEVLLPSMNSSDR